MKAMNLAEYANDDQEREQLRLKSAGPAKEVGEGIVTPKPLTFEVTGGMDPLVLNKRKGNPY